MRLWLWVPDGTGSRRFNPWLLLPRFIRYALYEWRWGPPSQS